MPATISLQRIVVTGLEATLAPATALGDTIRTGPGVVLYVVNADIGAHTVTLVDATSREPDEAIDWDPNVAVIVGAGAKKFIPIPDRFRDPDDGFAHITYDDVTDVTVCGLLVPKGTLGVRTTGATIARQRITQGGLAPSYTNAAASQKLKPGLRSFVHVRNAHNADHTITFDDPTSVSPTGASAFNPDVAVVVTQAEERFIGPIDGRFADPADTGRADITWSATTSMSIASLSV